MARIYANENFPLPTIEELRKLGHDVLTVLDAGKAGLAESDKSVLRYASKDSRILLTLNRKHFIRLHNDHPKHAGIVVCSFDPDFEGQARRIHVVIESEEPMCGKLVRVNRPR